MIVIAGSSPLIYLSRARVLHIPTSMFGEVVVPQVVWDEVVTARTQAPGVVALLAASWFRVDARTLPDIDPGLDSGETAGILLAEAVHADLLLLDERAGRSVAHARGLVVRGTLGVLVRARETGLVPALRPILDRLTAEGFRLSPSLVAEALRRVGESSSGR